MAEDNSELLARVDERTKAMQFSMEKLVTDVRLINDNLSKKIDETEDRLDKRIDSLEQKIEVAYVKKDQFNPVQRLVYGITGLILTAVVVAILTTVFKTPTIP